MNQYTGSCYSSLFVNCCGRSLNLLDYKLLLTCNEGQPNDTLIKIYLGDRVGRDLRSILSDEGLVNLDGILPRDYSVAQCPQEVDPRYNWLLSMNNRIKSRTIEFRVFPIQTLNRVFDFFYKWKLSFIFTAFLSPVLWNDKFKRHFTIFSTRLKVRKVYENELITFVFPDLLSTLAVKKKFRKLTWQSTRQIKMSRA